MKKILLLSGLFCWAFFSMAQGDSKTNDERMEWWREARFGMFIHWGVYSVPAGIYNGQKINRLGEWIMNRGKIPVAEYQKFAKEFNPVKFDADAWVPQKSVGKKGLNKVEVLLADSMTANLSISITDADLNESETYQDNIISHLLLTSDLRGRIDLATLASVQASCRIEHR